ncbi:hypothetical protein ACFXA3_06610 [Streptomyces sp. NPDC059456]|uniref:hypothetical protein n=1 Tax=Streptomyces sp. NPDC059456 TaxID=3346838 RepID=UPI00367CA11B
MRHGEAFAVSLDNLVASDVYRITEQVNQTTKTYGRLRHRKPTDHRDVPLPARIRVTLGLKAFRDRVSADSEDQVGRVLTRFTGARERRIGFVAWRRVVQRRMIGAASTRGATPRSTSAPGTCGISGRSSEKTIKTAGFPNPDGPCTRP